MELYRHLKVSWAPRGQRGAYGCEEVPMDLTRRLGARQAPMDVMKRLGARQAPMVLMRRL